jgi:uncharacterized protein YbaP (TraB family)
MTTHLLSRQMRRRTAVFGVCLFFSLLVAANGQAQPNEAGSSSKSCLWVVETKSNRLFLLGSLHVFKSEAYPLADAINQAYTSSQRLVFETDLKAMMDPAIQAKMLALGVYPEGQNLFQHISEGTKKHLEDKLADLGLPAAHFMQFKPWLLAVTLTMLDLQRLGFNPLYGVDVYFFTKATADGKEIEHLETVEYQLDLLGNMNTGDQKAFLDQTLKDLEISAQLAGDMMKFWQTGDVDKLYALLFKSFEDYPDIEDRLLTRRNHDWLLKIEKMLAEPKKTMIIVGAGHLIGPEGLVALLRQRGYVVKQL